MGRGLPLVAIGQATKVGFRTCTLSNGTEIEMTKFFSARDGAYQIGARLKNSEPLSPEIGTVIYNYHPGKPSIGINVSPELNSAKDAHNEFTAHMVEFAAGANTCQSYNSNNWKSNLDKQKIMIYKI